MDGWDLPWEGGCRCGAVRLRVTKPPLLTGICHCTGCRRMSGSAFSLTRAGRRSGASPQRPLRPKLGRGGSCGAAGAAWAPGGWLASPAALRAR